MYKKRRSLTQPLSAVRLEAEEIFDKALNSYNPDKGVRPMTYIHGYVDNKLNRYVNDNAQMVRIVEKHSANVPEYKESLAHLTTELGRRPTDAEILAYMKKTYPNRVNVRLKDIARLRRDLRATSYGSTTIGKGNEGSTLTVEDITFVEGADDPMGDYLTDLKAVELKQKVALLPEPHKTIISHNYAFPGYQKLSLRDLALKLGVNKYRIQEYIKEAEVMLRGH